MAIVWMDGFDGYTADDDYLGGNRWTSRNHTAVDIYNTEGVDGGSALWTTGNSGRWCQLDFASVGPNITIGCWMKFGSITSAPTFIRMQNASAENQLEIGIDNTTNKIVVRFNGTDKISSTTVVSEGAYYHVQAQMFQHDTTGTLELKINGTSEGSLSSQDTINGSSGITRVLVGNLTATNAHCYIDDLWFDNTLTWHDNYKIYSLYPTADNTVAWSRSGGSTNEENIDEVGFHDGDTTYVYSSTNGQEDLYDFDDLPTGSYTIAAAQVFVAAKLQTSGTRQIATRTKNGADERTGSSITPTAGSYGQYGQIHTTYDGSNPWTKAKVDGAQFGIKVTS